MDEPGTEPTARQIAAFDFDGTLTKRDTVLPFLVRLFGARRVGRAVSRVAPTAARARLGRLEGELHHRDVVKERLLHVLFHGEDPDHVAAVGRSFADTIPARLQTETMARVAWHREQGHALVIVSASLLAYLEPFAADHGFDHVIGVGLEVGERRASDRSPHRTERPGPGEGDPAARLARRRSPHDVGLRQLERRPRAARHGRPPHLGDPRPPPSRPAGATAREAERAAVRRPLPPR